MIAKLHTLLTAAVAISSSARANPIGRLGQHGSLSTRQSDAGISAVGEPVLVDAIGNYMRTTNLDDGSILAGYLGFKNGTKSIRAARSTDGGDTWELLSQVFERQGDNWNLGNACPIALGGGRVLMSFRNHEMESEDNYINFRIPVYESEDSGKTWTYLSDIDKHDANPSPEQRNGLWEPFFRLADDGKIQAYYTSENNATDQDNLMKTSSDGGKTWGNVVDVSGIERVARDGMVGVAKAGNDGKLIAVFETTTTTETFSIEYTKSDNDGQGWPKRGKLYKAPNGRAAGAPQVINVGGALVASFMEDQDSDVNLGQVRIVTSRDNGETWSEPTTVNGVGSSWPGLHVLDDTTFLALYSTDERGLLSHKYRVN